MIGARMVAEGAMGRMERQVWAEGDVLGTGKVAHAVLDNAVNIIHSLGKTLKVALTIESRPYDLHIDAGTTVEQLASNLSSWGVRANVAGLIANAIRSHVLAGGNGPLRIDIDL